jgi:hypothetical protein
MGTLSALSFLAFFSVGGELPRQRLAPCGFVLPLRAADATDATVTDGIQDEEPLGFASARISG